jgi:putative spermidine/putrescine transport system ATP-binding protein
MNALVEFRRVSKTYDGATLVVRDLDLAVRRGEFLTLLGPSGSGKTTTLMMLAGFETPSAGDILLAGRTITHVPPYERGIGMVFQNYALFPHMTVAENVAFPLDARGMARSEKERRVARALDMVQLAPFAGRRPAQLSGGQQQRVALARALVFDPELVLMDEPLGALDKQLREHMQMEIRHLHQRVGVTVVYVTHDQAEALAMSDRIVVFNEGRAQQIAPPAELYERPANAFVAGFIGENNRLPGRIEAVRDGIARVALEGGGSVLALARAGLGPGDATTVSVRPERVLVAPADDVPNRFEAEVEELVYLGDSIRARLALGAIRDFMLRIGNIHGQTLPREGERISIGWRTEDALALDPG